MNSILVCRMNIPDTTLGVDSTPTLRYCSSFVLSTTGFSSTPVNRLRMRSPTSFAPAAPARSIRAIFSALSTCEIFNPSPGRRGWIGTGRSQRRVLGRGGGS
ncbi:hypothetical protein RB213_013768, partial [Colletotrichum asianum]